jgi:hypothetical protein
MGNKIIDQYSLLHFSSGCIAYFFGINLTYWIIIHTIFELTENSSKGVYFIDNYLKFWPGGKKAPDNLLNSLSDLIFAIIGFMCAYYLDKYYTNNYVKV